MAMSSVPSEVPVIIVGAGAAGLATGACLKMRGVESVILEAGEAPGTTWRSLYDRLHLHTVKRLSGLPGYPMPRRMAHYPSRTEVADYLSDYAKRFVLHIETNCPVSAARRDGERWIVTTPQGERSARVLVSATGIFRNPETVAFPEQDSFRGTILNASIYKNAEPYAGQRVLVVGSGNTGAELAVDLAEHGIATSVAIRAGTNVVPRDLLGLPIQRWAHILESLPRTMQGVVRPAMLRRSAKRQLRAGVPRATAAAGQSDRVPIIGLAFLDEVKRGRIAIQGAIERFTPTGVRFADGHEAEYDTVILATGYLPALDYLAGVVPLDATGRPRVDGMRALDAPDLYFVALHQSIRGTLYIISREAPEVARQIAASLQPAATRRR
jgi:cation diffusion facilitator CzcD-associated flavoprotein CzcO